MLESEPLVRERLKRSQALIEQGYAFQNQGDFRSASKRYRAALELIPKHPTALQLLGLIAKREGNAGQAQSLMQASLDINPNQPHVWNNLANVFLDLGEPTKAAAALDEALRQDQNYVDARLNRAKLRLRLGELTSAEADVAVGLARDHPHFPKFLQLKAQLLSRREAFDDALVCLDLAITKESEDGSLHHDRGVALHQLGRNPESIDAHGRAEQLGVRHTVAAYNRANTLQALGRHAEAQSAYMEACVIDPANVLAQVDLARFRWRQGDPYWDETLLAALQHPSFGLNAALHGAYGQLLWQAGQDDSALRAWTSAAKLAPGQAQWKEAMGRALVRAGEISRGIALQREALSIEQDNASFHASLATSLLIAGDLAQADHHVQQTLLRLPLDQYAWALQELCWRASRDSRHSWLCDFDRLLHIEDLSPPSGWQDMESFNQQLAAELTALHHDSKEPLDQTLRRGTQSVGDLHRSPTHCVGKLLDTVNQTVQRFLVNLPKDSLHPFLGRIQSDLAFKSSWSTRLSRDGFHTNHVHPKGWLSLAYYVCVPASCQDSEQKQGWLQFGRPESAMPASLSTLRQVQPKPGRLVLFPSFMWHGTYPFGENALRMAVSADILPRSH